jgi:amidophosphoribosyltransferase
MGGFFSTALKENCIFDLFYGTDYHSHLGTRRAGLAVYGEGGFTRAIHNIENSPFRTKFTYDVQDMNGYLGIGCISDYDPQPLVVRSHHGAYAIACVGRINNAMEIVENVLSSSKTHYMEMSGGEINKTELVATLINQCDNLVEGFVPAAFFPNSKINEDFMTLTCGDKVYTLGTQLDVTLTDVDVPTGKITFEPYREDGVKSEPFLWR